MVRGLQARLAPPRPTSPCSRRRAGRSRPGGASDAPQERPSPGVSRPSVTWPCCHPAGLLYARGPPDVLALVSALEELGAAGVGHAPQLVAGTGCREGLRYLKGVRDGLGELRSCVWEVSCVGVAAVDLGRGSVGCHLGTGPCCTGVRRLRVVSRSAISASMASKMTS